MRKLQDIFSIWDSLADLARDLGAEYQTVAKWAQRGRIPPESWPALIAAAKRKKVVVTPALLSRLNRPRDTANLMGQVG